MTLNESRWRCLTAVGCLCRSFLAAGSPPEEIMRRGAAAIGLPASCSSRMSHRCGSATKCFTTERKQSLGEKKGDKLRPVDFILIFQSTSTVSFLKFLPEMAAPLDNTPTHKHFWGTAVTSAAVWRCATSTTTTPPR